MVYINIHNINVFTVILIKRTHGEHKRLLPKTHVPCLIRSEIGQFVLWCKHSLQKEERTGQRHM